MKAFALLLLSSLTLASALAQQVHPITVPLGGVQQVQAINTDFSPRLQVVEIFHAEDEVELIASRTTPNMQYADSIVELGNISNPVMGSSFTGNPFNFKVPNDNDIAISNNGKLISVTNSNICYYDAERARIEKIVSLESFADPLGFGEIKFDPRVIYDPEEDKFIIVFLNGPSDTTSRIIVAFSDSNDPLGHWNLYSLNGNPFNNRTFADFPKVGLSKSELYISYESFRNDHRTHVGTSVWQINKFDGYNGDSLQAAIHPLLSYRGTRLAMVYPVTGGNGLYGPPFHFVSTQPGGDDCYILTLDNTIDQNGQISAQSLSTVQPFWNPTRAYMPGGDSLDCGTKKILGAFFENEILQFVGGTFITTTNRNGIYHGIIEGFDSGNLSVDINFISDTTDLAYPSIAYVGVNNQDNSAMLVMNNSSSTVYPGAKSLLYDGNGNYSDLLVLKEGSSSINLLSTQVERWGDYTDIQPKYDEPGVAWSASTFGRNLVHNTWIAELTRDFGVEVSEYREQLHPSIAPNPATDQVKLSFTLPKDEKLVISLFDMQGRPVAEILSDHVPAGVHNFTCSVGHLPLGVYVIAGKTLSGATIFSEKVIKQ